MTDVPDDALAIGALRFWRDGDNLVMTRKSGDFTRDSCAWPAAEIHIQARILDEEGDSRRWDLGIASILPTVPWFSFMLYRETGPDFQVPAMVAALNEQLGLQPPQAVDD